MRFFQWNQKDCIGDFDRKKLVRQKKKNQLHADITPKCHHGRHQQYKPLENLKFDWSFQHVQISHKTTFYIQAAFEISLNRGYIYKPINRIFRFNVLQRPSRYVECFVTSVILFWRLIYWKFSDITFIHESVIGTSIFYKPIYTQFHKCSKRFCSTVQFPFHHDTVLYTSVIFVTTQLGLPAILLNLSYFALYGSNYMFS